MSARVFLTESLNDAVFCESLSEFLSAALFDVWLGGDAREVKPDLVIMTAADEPHALSDLNAPMIILSDKWIDGADDVVSAADFDLLAASARSLIRHRQAARVMDHYADMAQSQGLLQAADGAQAQNHKARLLVCADQQNFTALAAQLDDRHQFDKYKADEQQELNDFELIIIKDDLDVFVQIAARPDHHVPVMFWCADKAKLVKALAAEVAGYIPDLSQAAPRIADQLRKQRARASLRRHLGWAFDMAIKDELTGLYNRRCLTAHLPEMIKTARHKDRRLAVILLDLDRFKNVNDYWGHDAGDAILQHVAGLLQKTLRAHDALYRIGGEEFLAVMPDVSGMEEAYAIARRLCAAVRDAHFILGQTAIPVTISAGVGLFQSGERVQNLLKRADQALFRAKRLGRNQAA